ncbi:hypothetical protein [Microcystis phage Mae-Yong924-2]|nr:hypothetical protein [Microcystis phage Mea-Yong924-1]QYC50710.1 hypothetical protein [Microcystis phage Mae-Yong924-2]
MQTIHDRLERVQQWLGKNQKEFAEECLHTTKQRYSAILKVRSNFHIDLVQALAIAAPQLNVHWLITGDGNMVITRNSKYQFQESESLMVQESPGPAYGRERSECEKELENCKKQLQLYEELLAVYRMKLPKK